MAIDNNNDNSWYILPQDDTGSPINYNYGSATTFKAPRTSACCNAQINTNDGQEYCSECNLKVEPFEESPVDWEYVKKMKQQQYDLNQKLQQKQYEDMPKNIQATPNKPPYYDSSGTSEFSPF